MVLMYFLATMTTKAVNLASPTALEYFDNCLEIIIYSFFILHVSISHLLMPAASSYFQMPPFSPHGNSSSFSYMVTLNSLLFKSTFESSMHVNYCDLLYIEKMERHKCILCIAAYIQAEGKYYLIVFFFSRVFGKI